MNYKNILVISISILLQLFSICFAEDKGGYVGVTTSIVAGGKPWTDSSVVSRNNALVQPELAQDFYAHENYNWFRDTTFDETVSTSDNFSYVNSEVIVRLGRILNTPYIFSHDARITQKAYSLVVNWDARDKLGLKPLLDDVKAIESINTMEEMNQYLIGQDVPPSGFLSINMQVDFDNSSRYALNIDPMGLTLGDSAEYANRTSLGERLQKANDIAIKKMLLLSGYSEKIAEEKIAAMYRVENSLADTIHTTAQQAKADYVKLINHHVTREQLQEMAGPYPIIRMMDYYGLGNSELINLPNPEYLQRLTQVYREDNLQDLKGTLIAYRMLEEMEQLNSAANDIAMEHSKAVYGYKIRRPDWVRGVDYVKEMLPGPLSNLYVEQFCKMETKQEIEKIVAEICGSYKEMLRSEPFLSEETRQQAINKLDKLKVRAVMPDKQKNWKDIKLNKCKSIKDMNRAIGKWKLQCMAKEINGPVNHSWCPAYTVNANYSLGENSISIPAGILNDCFYQPDFSYEEKLGGIGMIIGHEISHAFDTTGSQFDENGNIRNWWSKADKDAYDARAQKLIEYYNGITIFKGLNCNGELNKTEAIADMGAMKCMLAMASKRKDFDYKKFFRHYAKLWRSVSTKESEEMQARTDSHPLDYLRVNVCVQQFEEFNKAFDIKPTDNMYLAPEKRVLVW